MVDQLVSVFKHAPYIHATRHSPMQHRPFQYFYASAAALEAVQNTMLAWASSSEVNNSVEWL